jgi:hypothetical protein
MHEMWWSENLSGTTEVCRQRSKDKLFVGGLRMDFEVSLKKLFDFPEKQSGEKLLIQIQKLDFEGKLMKLFRSYVCLC